MKKLIPLLLLIMIFGCKSEEKGEISLKDISKIAIYGNSIYGNSIYGENQ